jgi:hypothetical protein
MFATDLAMTMTVPAKAGRAARVVMPEATAHGRVEIETGAALGRYTAEQPTPTGSEGVVA